jgi:hypothetical protein
VVRMMAVEFPNGPDVVIVSFVTIPVDSAITGLELVVVVSGAAVVELGVVSNEVDVFSTVVEETDVVLKPLVLKATLSTTFVPVNPKLLLNSPSILDTTLPDGFASRMFDGLVVPSSPGWKSALYIVKL